MCVGYPVSAACGGAFSHLGSPIWIYLCCIRQAAKSHAAVEERAYGGGVPLELGDPLWCEPVVPCPVNVRPVLVQRHDGVGVSVRRRDPTWRHAVLWEERVARRVSM